MTCLILPQSDIQAEEHVLKRFASLRSVFDSVPKDALRPCLKTAYFDCTVTEPVKQSPLQGQWR